MNPFNKTFPRTFLCLFILVQATLALQATSQKPVSPVQEVVTFTKLSDFPISIGSGLSALAGDSLIIKDSLAASGKFSAINVSDPSHPKFDGFVDSTSLLSYPIKTLLPVFLKYGIANGFGCIRISSYNDKILMIMDPCLKRYQIQNNNLVLIDSLVIDTLISGFWESFLGQSIFLVDTAEAAVLGTHIIGPTPVMHDLLPISLAGFSMLPTRGLGSSFDGMANCEKLEINLQGISNNRIFVSTNDIHCDPMMKQDTLTNETTYDLSLSQITTRQASYINSCNTGCFISGIEALSTTFKGTGTELFVSDVSNFYSYEFALAHNGVYRDTIHTKGQLKNILLDTVDQKVYLVFASNLTILSYQRGNSVMYSASKTDLSRGIVVRLGASGTTIFLPDNFSKADISIYDLSGREVEKMRNITSNAVLFRPKSNSANCYIAVVRNNGRQYSARFMTK